MKKALIVGVGIWALLVMSPAKAGVRVSFFWGFGSPGYYHPYCGPYWGPSYGPIYYGPPMVYYTPVPVIYEPVSSVIYTSPPTPSSSASTASSSTTASSNNADTTYFRLGRDWAQDLRNEVVSWDQFVGYLKDNSLESSPVNFHEFRNGFLAAYGVNASAAFDKAIHQSHKQS